MHNGISRMSTTTLCVELNKGEFLHNKVVRLEKGWILRFKRGCGLIGNEARLRICETDRVLQFPALSKFSHLDEDDVRDYQCDTFGAFKYEFFLASDSETAVGCGYFAVVPQWTIADGGRVLSLNSLSVITHISKLLGPLREWEDRLRVSKEAGYNAIHFTPVHTLGISNSAYSIADYHQLNPAFESDLNGLESLVKKMEREWHMLSIQDVVWNHCAKNSEWIWQHPECSYNCLNSPHLRPAFVVDRALCQLSKEIGAGKWESRGVPATINSHEHLGALRRLLEEVVFPSLKLDEFFRIDVNKWVGEFEKRQGERRTAPEHAISLIPDPEYRRFGASVDVALALSKCGSVDEFRSQLEALNSSARDQANDHITAAINAVMGHATYTRVDPGGPKWGLVTGKAPLVTAYFLYPVDRQPTNWEEEEKLAYDPSVAKYFMACNGWVMNADVSTNFAEPPSNVYLRRELICWGDCVKLNYGRGPEDCPYLWDYMQRYSETCARIFHGFRIDNCHSTPIHVAEVEPNIHFMAYLIAQYSAYVESSKEVMAELFTSSEEHDNLFVNRLGITSLIRECQNAEDSHEQGRFVYRYGGAAVGAFRSKSTRPAPPSVPHALLYDQTHDNPAAAKKRTAYDHVPTAAMTAMAYCASGTTRGYDEFLHTNVDVVKETRLYRGWSEMVDAKGDAGMGMIKARKLFNDLHVKLSEAGFSEIFVDQRDADIVAITRHHPITHETVLLVAHTCFKQFRWTPNDSKPLDIADDIVDILFEVKTVENPNIQGNEDTERLGGMPQFSVEIYEHVPFDKCDAVTIHDGKINFKVFTSGSVVAFKITPKKETTAACQEIEGITGSDAVRNELISSLERLDLPTFAYILFQCEAEEGAKSEAGSYEIPGFGKLVYCGLQGVESLLRCIQETNDLGHPLCGNLRAGNWLSDYIVGRLKLLAELDRVAGIFDKCLSLLDNGVPHYLRPCYFELLFTYLYSAVEEVALRKIFSNSVLPRLVITNELVLSSISFLSTIPNARLPPPFEERPSMAAGLPHFAEGIWRNWGRDTFIALPGILLLTGRYEEAKSILLAFAGTLRHGLIPNLLAEGKKPRYNCRDATWFWLVAILRYTRMAPGKEKFLKEPVQRLYPIDDSEFGVGSKHQPLHDTMYEALQRHFSGIAFRERDAGPGIDEHMTDQGFNVNAYIDKETGLIFGGNEWNCGTWMDKMGSSDRAGNKGQPATPRDGAAVELQGLALLVAEEMDKLSASGHFPYSGLDDGNVGWTWKEWALKIRYSFGDRFFVSDNCDDEYVNRRGIIKDTFGSTAGYADFQLRPNFCIALDAVPDIIDPENSWRSLELAREYLDGPLGICTLDKEDWAYNGNYNNDDDGTNKMTAKGWNYHQGPEWVWVAAAYMSARLKVAHNLKKRGNDSPWKCVTEEIKEKIYRYYKHINENVWKSLPELTNRNGALCHFSCPAQAWSVGYILDALCTFNSLMFEKEK